jgi:hypothetical protein
MESIPVHAFGTKRVAASVQLRLNARSMKNTSDHESHHDPVIEARFASNKFTASALSFHATLFSFRYRGRLMALLVASVLLQARRTVSN